nr:hypothetical protein [Tanacetum cinerariifolium]
LRIKFLASFFVPLPHYPLSSLDTAPPSPVNAPDLIKLEDHVPMYVPKPVGDLEEEPEEDSDGDIEEDPINYADDDDEEEEERTNKA